MRRGYWLLAVGLFLIGIVAAIYFLMLGPKITNTSSSGKNIIAFGDSLTYGVGSSPGNDYASVLSDMLDQPVLNAGVSGDTTKDALKRLQRDVLERNPRIIIILLGGNDLLAGVREEETYQDLSTVIDRIHSAGAAVVLVGIRGAPFLGSLEETYAALAKEKKTAYVPNVLDDIWDRRELMSDPIHPNDRGYALMAERIAPVVRKLLR